MEQHIIYTLVGQFISGYHPVFWKFEEAKDAELAPIPAIALFKSLKKQNKNVKLKFLVPHSLFIDNLINSQVDTSSLAKAFKEDFFNYYSRFNFKRFFKNLNEDLDSLEVETVKRQIKTLLSLFKLILGQKIIEEYEELCKEDNEKDLKEALKIILDDIIKKFQNGSGIEELNLKNLNGELQRYSDDIEVEIIPSAGKYRKDNYTFNYSGWDYNTRVLNNYLIYAKDLLNFLTQKEISSLKVYLDTSVGLNSLVVETLEAYNSAVVLWNFFFLGKEKNKGNFYLLSSEPVLRKPFVYEEKTFSKVPIDKKAFFEKPLNWEEFNKSRNTDKLGIYQHHITNLVKLSLLNFSAIKYNAPLIFTLNNSSEKEEDFIFHIKNLIDKLLQKMKIKIAEQTSSTYNIQLQNKKYFHLLELRNLTYLLMLGANLSKNIKNIPLLKIEEDNTIALEITERNLQKFKELYEHYNLVTNSAFLERDWKRLQNLSSTNWEKLCKLIAVCQQQSLKNYLKTDKFKRNFLAHSGFEDNITEIKGDKVRYVRGLKREIENFILSL